MMKQKLFATFITFFVGGILISMNACSEFTATNNFSSVSDINNSEALFAKTIEVIQRDCVSCHRAGGSTSSFEFTTPQQFISAGLIIPGKPRQSKLIYRMINFNDASVTNDNMPMGGSAISNSDYQDIYNWIAEMPSDSSPFACEDDSFRASDVNPTNAKRLSIRQYTNTLKDLLTIGTNRTTANSLVDTALTTFELPGDTGQIFKRENNSFSGAHAQSFFDIADQIATTISTTHLANFVTKFIQLDPGTCSSINASNLSTICRDQLIQNFASRAFRRPLRDLSQNLSTTSGSMINEPAELASEFSGVNTQEGVSRLIFRVLIAPHFLYQLEDQNLVQSTNLGSNTYMLSPHAYISRLTYRFWNTMPDETLWQMAVTENFSNNTGHSNVLNYVISQKLKIDDSMREYMNDWLKLDQTPNFNVSARFALVSPSITFNPNLRMDMIREVEELGSYVTTSGGSFEDLFVSDVSLARSTNLMRVYNQNTAAPAYASLTEGNAIRFPANTRAGILTRAAMLISGSEFTNPIIRGAHLRKNILCLNLGAPPSNAIDTFNGIEVPNHLSTREKVSIKTAGTDCVGCHNLINPLGFGFSNFNSFGSFINQEPIFSQSQNVIESYVPVTSSVDLSAFFGSGANAQNATELSRIVSQQESAKICFAEKLMSYSMGRTISRTQDACRLDKIYNNLNADDPLIDAVRSSALDMEFRVRKIQGNGN
jgi:hypothetical protein